MQDRHATGTETVVRVDFARSPPPELDRAGGADQPWDRVLATLARDHPAHYRNWFSDLGFGRFCDGVLNLTAPNSFAQRYVATHLLEPLVTAAEPEFGSVARVVFE